MVLTKIAKEDNNTWFYSPIIKREFFYEADAVNFLQELPKTGQNNELYLIAEDKKGSVGPDGKIHEGAKKFHLSDYKSVYDFSRLNTASLYETRTAEQQIKLHFDMDMKREYLVQYNVDFSNADVFFRELVLNFYELVCRKLRLDITNCPVHIPVIVLKSDNKKAKIKVMTTKKQKKSATKLSIDESSEDEEIEEEYEEVQEEIEIEVLAKLSYHMTFPTVVFSNIKIMKNFVTSLIQDIPQDEDKFNKIFRTVGIIDPSIYKKSYFRLMLSTKRDVNCKLRYYTDIENLVIKDTDFNIFKKSVTILIDTKDQLLKINEDKYKEAVPDVRVAQIRAVKPNRRPNNADNEFAALEEFFRPAPKEDSIRKAKFYKLFQEMLNKLLTNNKKEIYEIAYNLSASRITIYDTWINFVFLCSNENLKELCLFISECKFPGFDTDRESNISFIEGKFNDAKRGNHDKPLLLVSLYAWSRNDNPIEYQKILNKYYKLKLLPLEKSSDILLKYKNTFINNFIEETTPRITQEALDKMANYKAIILEAGTGLGKTYTMCNLCTLTIEAVKKQLEELDSKNYLQKKSNEKPIEVVVSALSVTSRISMTYTHLKAFKTLRIVSYRDLQKKATEHLDEVVLDDEGDLLEGGLETAIEEEEDVEVGEEKEILCQPSNIKHPVDKSRYIISFEQLGGLNGFYYDILILDEIASLLSHLNSTTMSKFVRKSFNTLVSMITKCKRVIVADATMTDEVLCFLSTILGKQEIVYYKNHFKNKKGVKLNVYNMKNNKALTEIDLFCNKISPDIEADRSVMIMTDSKKVAETIHTKLRDLHTSKDKSYFKLYSSDVGDRDELIDPDTFWLNKIITFTPTITFGLDVNIPYNSTWAIYTSNSIDSFGMLQQISRARNTKEVNVLFLTRSWDDYHKPDNFYMSFEEHCMLEDRGIKDYEAYINSKFEKEDIEKALHKKFLSVKPEFRMAKYNYVEEYINVDLPEDFNFRKMFQLHSWYKRLFSRDKSQLMIKLCEEQGYTISYYSFPRTMTVLAIDNTQLIKDEVRALFISILNNKPVNTQYVTQKDVIKIAAERIKKFCRLFKVTRQQVLDNRQLIVFLTDDKMLEATLNSLLLYRNGSAIEFLQLKAYISSFPELEKDSKTFDKIKLIQFVEKQLNIKRFYLKEITQVKFPEKEIKAFKVELTKNKKLLECFSLPNGEQARKKRITKMIAAITNFKSLIDFVVHCYNNIATIFTYTSIRVGNPQVRIRSYTLNEDVIKNHQSLLTFLKINKTNLIDIDTLLNEDVIS